jgi:Tfp pilus assembly protein PilZ
LVAEDERRRRERVPINDEFARLGGSTWVSDLSLGGVFVHTQELLPVGSMIDLRFTILLEDPVVIEAFGKVVRHSHKPRGMGVEFAAMSPTMGARIEEVLESRRPLDSGAPLRLPEPSREPVGLPVDDDDDDNDDTTNRVVFARPAPVEGLDLRRMHKQEFEDAVTASFPRLDSAPKRAADPQAKTSVFRPPPSAKRPPSKPQAQATPRETKDDDRTRVYKAVRRDDD